MSSDIGPGNGQHHIGIGKFPGYFIYYELGTGGMGRVYKVRNQTDSRDRALKVLTSSRDIARAAFLEEAMTLETLIGHPAHSNYCRQVSSKNRRQRETPTSALQIS